MQVDELKKGCLQVLSQEFEAAKDYVPQAGEWLSEKWAGFLSPAQRSRIRNTGPAAWAALPAPSPIYWTAFLLVHLLFATLGLAAPLPGLMGGVLR